MHHRTLRIIDANLNRICEGLRVLEDISRFLIEDKVSSRQFKSMRHDLRRMGGKLGIILEGSRDAEGDIGADFDLTSQHRDYQSIVRANSKRIEEGLRVLEELAKLPEMSRLINGEKLKNKRYALYTLSKTMLLSLLQVYPPCLPSGIYLIINTDYNDWKSLTELTCEAIKAGAVNIGLRCKGSAASVSEVIDNLQNLKGGCEKNRAVLILHDQIDIAAIIKPHAVCIEESLIEPSLLRQAISGGVLVGKLLKPEHPYRVMPNRKYDFTIIEQSLVENKITWTAKSGRHSSRTLVFQLYPATTGSIKKMANRRTSNIALEIDISRTKNTLQLIRSARKIIETTKNV